ncbi:hypothetical protein IW261DRAFT_1372218 [Armillaria novae-zelandiae]|uniref:Heterokaryon incompatibility domain-containing protein n=1 Tax=Armillaria novae-zelandiae TaxID=153914 RepID=A0AA39NS97_9AGAR|nr:hypothetical protein IW261DRAFT_1372218 [Armillaria novae-zelandiae]
MLSTRIREDRKDQQFKLSAVTETGRAESSIEVPKQRSYNGSKLVIPRSLADTPCATLGVQGVLDALNAILETSHTLPTAASSSTSPASLAPSSASSVQDQLSRLSILKDFIERNYDFGTAYALLRPVWKEVSFSNAQDKLRRRERKDSERRRKALVGNRIVDKYLRPRRVWDLFSNRVVPSWINNKWITPISHAWVDEKDRVAVQTPINGQEWPVPLPKDADLNLIRIEMLNLGLEHTWLDILCLRQKGGPREDLRVAEWRLDVPTIGRVYRGADVVIYLSGLGRPLRLKEGDLDSDRSWFRRAWTVQEVGSQRIIAGDIPDGPMHAQRIYGGKYKTALLTRFHKELHSVEKAGLKTFVALENMQKRVSTNPVDRVAGLAFILGLRRIPVYHESETVEDAWTALVNAMQPILRVHFLLLYPAVGLGSKKWRPSWGQVMTEPPPKDVRIVAYNKAVYHDDKTQEDWSDVVCIERGCVRGFNVGSAEEHGDRCGELVVEAADGSTRTFKIRVAHRFLIPEDTYALLGCDLSPCRQWAIGRRLPDQRFEKVSVIEMGSYHEVDRLWEYTTRFKLLKKSRYILI